MAMQRENGKDVKQFMYVDKETGKIDRVNVNDIYIPKKIEGVDLTPAQMQSLKNGKNVNIEIENAIPNHQQLKNQEHEENNSPYATFSIYRMPDSILFGSCHVT